CLWICGGLFFFSSRRRHTRFKCDWSSDVCSSDLTVSDVLDILGFVGDLGNGCLYFASRIFGWGQGAINLATADYGTKFVIVAGRSEERRVGKECRSGRRQHDKNTYKR